MLSSLGRKIGVHNIEFESEEFNREFTVHADDRKFASDVIDPRMMQFLMHGAAPGFAIIGSDIVVVHGGRLHLEEVESTIAYLNTVVDHIPGFVWGAH